MSLPRPPSPQILNPDAPIFHHEPLPADGLPQEPTPRAGPPSIANAAVRSSQSPLTSPPPPPERPPQFAPLFALVSSSSFSASPSSGSSPTHHHPTVHYIFADDHDSDLLITAAALQTLDPDPSLPPSSDNGSPSNTPPRPRRVGDAGREKGSGGGGGAMAATSPERFLIVDLDPTATRVVVAWSMARDWQVVNADITPAPTWEGEERNSGETGQGKGD
ncbi:hypothetical protein MMC29_006679, partial [Sticta canariensis]|nr:hypothetical protein [Sticta canariensis]